MRDPKIDEILDLALKSTDVSDLIPEDLEPILVDLTKYQKPLLQFVPIGIADGKTHEFNQVTAQSQAEFEGENAVTRQRSFSTARVSKQCKIIRSSDGVTHFAQSATQKQIDLYKEALVRATRAMGEAIEFALVWASGKDSATPKDGDIYMYAGADQSITTNLIDHNGAGTLALLDQMIDETTYYGGMEEKMMFLLDPRMISLMSGLETRLFRQVPKVEYPGGMRLTTYRNIPMMPTGYNRTYGTMGVVATAQDVTVGLLEAKTYKYKVSYVSIRGESVHCAEVSQLAVAADSIKLSWTAITSARLFKIYRTLGDGAADSEVLLVTIPAKTYDSDGTVTGNVVSYVDGLADAVVGTQKPLTATDQVIHLLCMDSENSFELESLKNQLGEPVSNLIQYFELAKTKSAKNFNLESFQVAAWKGERYNAMARRVRLA